MKKIVFLLFVLTGGIGFSQEAKTLLQEVAETTKSYENIYIEFTNKLDNTAANLHQETNGNVTLQGDLYRFNYMDVEVLFDGILSYTIIPEDEEVIISKPRSNDDNEIITPSNFLTFYENGFSYEMDIAQKVRGRKIQYVKLIPMDSESELKTILIGVDTKTNNIYKVIQTGIDDTVTTITVSKMITNQSISEHFFTFDEIKFESDGYYITKPK